jgi:ClpP class serine protease
MRFLIALLIIFGLDTRQLLARGAVTACVPHYSMSGGTLIALAANEIVMCQQSILGPIDLQVGSFPAASLIKAINQKPIAESAVAGVLLPVRKMTAVNDHLSASGRFDMERGSQQRQMLTSPGL